MGTNNVLDAVVLFGPFSIIEPVQSSHEFQR